MMSSSRSSTRRAPVRRHAHPTAIQGELMITILAGFATFERHLIKARTEDGRKRAKDKGVKFGGHGS